MSAISDRLKAVVFNGHSVNAAGLTLAEVHFILSNDTRRWVIREIAEDDDIVVGEMTDRLTEVVSGPRFDRAERMRQYVSLHQTHLPQLDKHGVIDYSDANRVHRSDAYDAVVAVMDAVEEVVG